MSIRQLFVVASLGGLILGSAALAQSASTPDTAAIPLNVEQVLHAARQSPDVMAALRTTTAARADVLAADRAPAPTLSAGAASIDLRNGNGAGSFWTQKRLDKSLGLDWIWERGNKRALRVEAAERAARAANADNQDVLVRQQIGAQGAFYDLMASQDNLRTLEDLATGARTLAKTAELRLKAGDVSAQDAARTRIEAERTLADLQSARLVHEQAMLALSAWMGQPVPTVGWQAQGLWPEAQFTSSTDMDARIEQRPDVVAARERLAAAEAALESAQALNHADPTVGATFDHYPDGQQTNRLLALRISVPINGFSRFEGEIARAIAQKEQAQDLLDKTRLQARADMQGLRQAWLRQSERLQGYEVRILPQARQVAAQAELAYGKGGLSLTDLLDARRTLRSTLLEATAVRNDHAKAQGAWQLRTAP